MDIFAWLGLGLISGLIASRIVHHRGAGVILDVGLGIVGSFIGGLLFNFFGAPSISSFNVYSVLVGVMGAAATLALYHAAMGRHAV